MLAHYCRVIALNAPKAGAGRKSAEDRRESILNAAFRLVVRKGLHQVTTAAVSREAGIAAGTLFLYFPTKEALLNALYVSLIRRRFERITAGLEGTTAEKFRTFWFTWARWYLDEPEVTQVIQQFEVSTLLTEDSIAVREALDDAIYRMFLPDSAVIHSVPLLKQVQYALIVGPILVLAQLQDKREVPITDQLLEETYRRVRRALED